MPNCVFIFHHTYTIGGKSSTQRERFLPDVCQLIMSDVCQLIMSDVGSTKSATLWAWNFSLPNCNKGALEFDRIVRFLKPFKLWLSWKKIDGFSKIDGFFFKVAKSGKFSVEFVSIDIISQKCLFHLNCEAFWEKIRKNSKLEKLGNMLMKTSKKRTLKIRLWAF